MTSLRTFCFAIALGLSGSCSAQDVVTNGYRDCVIAAAKSTQPRLRVLRYSDDEFNKVLKDCGKFADTRPDEESSIVDASAKSTEIYIETLSLLNQYKLAAKPVRSVRSDEPPPALQPSTRENIGKQQPKLGYYLELDLTTLYTPWMVCTARAMHQAAASKMEQGEIAPVIKNAIAGCRPVSDITDPEARRLLTKHGPHTNEAVQNKLIREHKSLMLQLATIGLLRNQGENLGSALEKSFDIKEGDISTPESSKVKGKKANQ